MTRAMNFDVTANDSASREFMQIAAAAEQLENRLERLDRLTVEPTAQLNIAPATRSAAQLQSRLDALRNVRASVEISGLAEARRDVTALVVEMRKLRNARVRIDIDGDGRAQVTALATQLRTLTRSVTVNVALGDGTFARDIARLHQRISALSGARVRIHIEVSPPGIREELNGIADALRRIRDTRARVTADTSSASVEVKKLSDALGKLGKATAIPLSIPGLVGTIGQVGSLGASVMQLTGVLGLVPAAGFAAGAGIAALAVGMNGLADALGPRGTEAEIKKVDAAMARLSPNARELVTQIRALGPAWSEVRLDVQERLLAGLGETAARVGGTYMPVLKTGLGGIADELNVGATGFADWVTSGRTVNDVNTILGNTRNTFRELAPAGVNVAAALTDIGVVGSGIMPELAAGATAATGRFREFIAEARRTGELEQWIRGGISAVEQLGRIAGNTGGILGAVFTASETAGYGFLDMVEQATGELDALLNSARGQNALVELLSESRDVVQELLPGLRDLSGAALDTVGAFASSDGLQRFASLVSETATAIAPLVARLGELGGETLGALSGGASLAVAALSPLSGAVGGLLDALGPVAPLVLAAVLAFKGLGLVTPLIVSAGAAMARTAALAGTLTAGLTGSLAAGAAAQGAMTRLAGAVSTVGRALPIVGVALIAAAAGFDAVTTSADEASAAIALGGRSAASAVQDLAAYGGVADYMRESWGAFGTVFGNALDAVTTDTAEFREGLDDVGRAQFDAAEAGARYYSELERSGPASAATRAAQQEYAAAVDAVDQAQRSAEEATRSHSDAMRDQASAAASALGANLNLADAARQVAAAEEAANAAIRDHGASSTEAQIAVTELTRAAMQQADAAKQVAINQAEASGSTDSAAAGEAAYAASLLNTAATLQGPARDAVLGQIASLSDAELAALSAGAAATGFATQLLTLPDGRTVTIAVDPETGEIVSTQALLDGMADADVAVNVETAEALASLDSFVAIVNGASGTVNIDGNPTAAGTALQLVLQAIAAGQATVTINGQAVPAQAALQQIIGQIAASGATVTINGQAAPASQVLSQTLAAISRGQGTVTINGQSLPAQGVLQAIIGTVNRSNGQVTINARDLATAVINAIPKSSTHTVTIRTSGRGPGGSPAFHDGGIAPAQPFHDGGVAVARMSMGGQRPRPFTAGRAQVFPPRMLRITGDRVDVDEFYIPDNSARRSMSLGREWARRRGMDLVPRGREMRLPVVASMGGGSVGQQMQAAITQVRVAAPAGPAVDVGAIVRELGQLRAELRTRTGVQVTQTISGSADPAETGRQSALALRLATR